MPSPSGPSVQLDLQRLRTNVHAIAAKTGVEVWAVVKANAYGLGITPVTQAIKDLVRGWCVFSLREAVDAQLWERTGKPAITLGPPDPAASPEDYLRARVRPAVSNIEDAKRLRPANPILSVDTGMQRFACPIENVSEAIAAGQITEAFTHATRLEHIHLLLSATAGQNLKLHAAASSLLGEPLARLNAVRPGLAMYQGAVRITAPLVEVHTSHPPIGYTGFSVNRHGVILCGYSHGLAPSLCLVNGQRQRIPEVGMQSAYVELDDHAKVGDTITLLGDSLTPQDLAPLYHATPHQVLLRLSRNAEPR